MNVTKLHLKNIYVPIVIDADFNYEHLLYLCFLSKIHRARTIYTQYNKIDVIIFKNRNVYNYFCTRFVQKYYFRI